MKALVFFAAFFPALLTYAASDVFLECEGEMRSCTKYSRSTVCGKDTDKSKHVIAFDGKSIRQIDDAGFLHFPEKCEVTETSIMCNSSIVSGEAGSRFEEKGSRSFSLNRTTGTLSWVYEALYGINNSMYNASEYGRKGVERRFEARCQVRQNKTLF